MSFRKPIAIAAATFAVVCVVLFWQLIRRPSEHAGHDEANSTLPASATTGNTRAAFLEKIEGPNQDVSTGGNAEKRARPLQEAEKLGKAAMLDEKEKTKLIQIATAECSRLNVPTQGRAADVTVDGDQAIVTFRPPAGTLGGSFIVKINRGSGKVMDTKIWR